MEGRTWDTPIPQIFHMETTDKRYVDHQGWEMYQYPVQRVYGQAVAMKQFNPSYGKRYIMISFGLGDSVAREDVDDDLYGVLNRVLPMKGGALARAFMDLKENQGATWFAVSGFASGSNVAGMFDGVSLFNTAHPISLNNSGTTVANRPSIDVDLSVTSVQAMVTSVETQLRPNNITYLKNEPRIVVGNPSLQFVADQIFHGKWQPFSADRTDNNQLRGKGLRFVQWPYFKKSGATGTNNAWFTVCKEHYLYWFTRSSYQLDTDYDVNTKSYIFTADERFTYGASDWRGTYGSSGS